MSGPKLRQDYGDASMLAVEPDGSTPISIGLGIGRVLDKSGAGNTAAQATSTSRAIWRGTYAAFDGVDDSVSTIANFDLTSTPFVTLVMGVRKRSDASRGVAVGFGPTSAVGGLALELPSAALNNVLMRTSNGTTTGMTMPAPATMVIVAEYRIGGLNRLTVNGVAVTSNNALTGSFGSFVLDVGRLLGAGTAAAIDLYELQLIGAELTTDQKTMLSQYMAQKTGIVLP